MARAQAALVCLSGLAPLAAPAAGTVYLVVGSDTAIWNAGGTVDVYTRYPYYRQDSFTDSNAPIYQVMDSSWRDQFKDSFGQSIKFTWWMMGGNIYRDAINLNVPLPNTMTLHLMQQYHGAAIRQFGDQLSLHYHTYLWSDYSGSGVFYWNQSRTFNEMRADFDVTLAQYLLEEGVFPVSFRSGWHFMDQDWQEYLNQLIPFSFHNNYPTRVGWYTNAAGPIEGVEDWSRAPSAFVPFHPGTNDYQLPGDGPGWNVRSVKIQSLSQALVDQMFAQAAQGQDQVACFWDHLPENFVANIARLAAMAEQGASAHPGVAFRYCTAVEAMQRWLGLTNQAPPQLSISQVLTGATLSLTIKSSVPIFQARPFVCWRDVFQQYRNVTSLCTAAGSNTWSVDLGLPTNLLAKVGVAVTDLAGNLTTQILRFMPDDLYLDNRDPAYGEAQGTWTSTTNAAWGTDARVALLNSNETARAGWFLPVTHSGRYRLAVQVPSVAAAASNVVFEIVAGSTNLLSVTLPAGISTNQWTYLASVLFDAALSNRVEMIVTGQNQPGARAVADVLRMTPVPGAGLPEVSPAQPIAVRAMPDGRYVLRFLSQAGGHYTVQRGSSLTQAWTTLETTSPAASGMMEYEDEMPPPGQAFYRIVSQ